MAQELVRRIQRGGTIVGGDRGRGRDEDFGADSDTDESGEDEEDEQDGERQACVDNIFQSRDARRYAEPQTAEFLRAARDQNGLEEIFDNHTGAGRFDFITNDHIDDAWSINGSTYNANEFGNYLAGYSAAYHEGFPGYLAARAGGVGWNVLQRGTESDLDRSSVPYIQDGAAQGALDQQRGSSIPGECDQQQSSNHGG